MAVITLTATGSNQVQASTALTAGAHRDMHVYNPSEHTIIVNVEGAVIAAADLITWVDLDGITEIPGTRGNGHDLIVGPGEFRNVAVVNAHTAANAPRFTARSAHGAGDYVGDTVVIGTLGVVNGSNVN